MSPLSAFCVRRMKVSKRSAPDLRASSIPLRRSTPNFLNLLAVSSLSIFWKIFCRLVAASDDDPAPSRTACNMATSRARPFVPSIPTALAAGASVGNSFARSFNSNWPALPPAAMMSWACCNSLVEIFRWRDTASDELAISSNDAPEACAVLATEGKNFNASSNDRPDDTSASMPSFSFSNGTAVS